MISVSKKKLFFQKLNEKIAEEEGSVNEEGGNSDRESNEDGSTADREETAEEKRVRIAKEYLRTMQKLEDSDSADDSSENIQS